MQNQPERQLLLQRVQNHRYCVNHYNKTNQAINTNQNIFYSFILVLKFKKKSKNQKHSRFSIIHYKSRVVLINLGIHVSSFRRIFVKAWFVVINLITFKPRVQNWNLNMPVLVTFSFFLYIFKIVIFGKKLYKD